MASDGDGVAALTERWADMVLEDEDIDFEPVGDGVGVVAEPESWVVVGRFLTEKLVKVEFMRQVMASIWRPVKGVQISELSPNLFMFVFYHYSDVLYVLEEGPWSFENNTLVCRQVHDGVLPAEVVLDAVDMWVQVYDLPVGYTSDIVLEQVGNFLGVFLRCDDRFAGTPWRHYYRIRVSIPVSRPIKRRMRLVKRDKTACWVSFKYERLHSFCFFCGMLGHSYKFCLKARESVIPVSEYPYGAGLRAGARRSGPRPVGEPWLIPVIGPVVATQGEEPNGVHGASAVRCDNRVVPAVVNDDGPSVVANAKRRREGAAGGSRRGSNNGDVTMLDVSKNLSKAGSGAQTRPSS
ncbi:uncharacterized protein LOC116010815 [Ipomoea triloba]|uniref:uncharacterized protein LOC116010815 n=1 Tax=Ipomoea triloba TaxID=35885 RepID=UPI00125DE1D2|nr:uncharacterized protein LOC116010815 [Ipomoea triloba]